jgi:tetratricopeptide (TPR) repeat protein
MDWNPEPGQALDGVPEKGYFQNIDHVRKNPLAAIALAFAGLSLAFGCAGPRLSDQIGFGIWAADNELWDEAIFRWKKVLEQNPQSVAAHNNLAVAYEKKGRWEEARKEYEAALRLAPDNAWVKANFKNFKDNLEPEKPEKKDKAVQDEKK